MLSIFTKTDCHMLNMLNFEQENRLKDVIMYHAKNKTGKRVNITIDCERITLDTTEVDNALFEARMCNPVAIREINQITK